jgi:hypothetical protein
MLYDLTYVKVKKAVLIETDYKAGYQRLDKKEG